MTKVSMLEYARKFIKIKSSRKKAGTDTKGVASCPDFPVMLGDELVPEGDKLSLCRRLKNSNMPVSWSHDKDLSALATHGLESDIYGDLLTTLKTKSKSRRSQSGDDICGMDASSTGSAPRAAAIY